MNVVKRVLGAIWKFFSDWVELEKTKARQKGWDE